MSVIIIIIINAEIKAITTIAFYIYLSIEWLCFCLGLLLVCWLVGWYISNRLKLNTDKNQFTCLGTRYQLAKVDTAVFIVNGSVVNILHVVTCLGVIIDQELTFFDHTRCLAGCCLYWLRQLRSIRRTLTIETTTALDW